MFLNCKNHWLPNKYGFIYGNKPVKSSVEKITLTQAKESFEKEFFDVKNLPHSFSNSDDMVDFVEKLFRDKFNPNRFETEFRKFIHKYTTNADEVDRYVEDVMKVYKQNFDQLRASFYRMSEQKLADFEGDVMRSTEVIGGLLDMAKNALQNGIDAVRAQIQVDSHLQTSLPKPAQKKSRIPIIGPMLNGVNVPILSPILDSSEYRKSREFQRETTIKFEKYLDAMDAKFFNLKWQRLHFSEGQMDRYKKLSDKFKIGMEKYAINQIKFIFENSHDRQSLTQRLQRLRVIINNNYKSNAKNNGFIDLPALEKLHKDSENVNHIIRLLSSGVDPDVIATQFESSQFFNREMWVTAVKNITEQLIQDATANGSEARVIAIVKKLTGSKGNMDFDTAKKKFKNIMIKRAHVGVKETLTLLNAFNKITNAERAEILELNGIKPALKPFVHREREYLLQRRTIPKNIDDRMVVEFMSTNLIGRRKILANKTRRIALFQAIRNIQHHYPKLYRKRAKSIPKDLHDKHYDISKPASHDITARIAALLTLSKEAEWIIRNLDKTMDYGDIKLVEQFDDTSYEKITPGLDLRFRDPNKLYKTGYITAASRSGFNGRDLGLAAVKGFIGLTIILNVMNARKADGGWISGIGQVMTNPFVIGSAGLWYGIDRYKENPEVATYLFQDAGGQRRIRTSMSLTKLAKKQGRSEMMDFVNNGNEFRAMRHIMKNPVSGAKKVTKMLKEVDKKYADSAKAQSKSVAKIKDKSKLPSTYSQVTSAVATGLDFIADPLSRHKAGKRELTKDIMKKYFPTEFDQYILSQLPDDKTSNKTRYLFFKEFLTNPKLNVRELQSNCLKWT